MNSTIPVLDLSPEITSLWSELNEAFQRVLRDGHFIMGQDVALFEQEAAAFLGVKHAIGLNSGTDALVIGLRALGVQPGDEVITSPFTFIATAEAATNLGAKPVFVDIDADSFNLDPHQIEKVISPRTKAIIPVHLYGHAADMTTIMEIASQYKLHVLEDVAQAFGGEFHQQKLGSIGHAAAFSFFPSKNLGAYGDGGLLTTNNDKVAETARLLRVHGARKKYFNEIPGYSSRLDTLQAAMLRVKLPHVADWNEGRRAAASRYNALLQNVQGIKIPSEQTGAYHVYHQYTIRIQDGKRDLVQTRLNDQHITSMVYYPIPLHQLPVYKDLDRPLPLPRAELAASEVLSLPIWSQITHDIQIRVVEALRESLT